MLQGMAEPTEVSLFGAGSRTVISLKRNDNVGRRFGKSRIMEVGRRLLLAQKPLSLRRLGKSKIHFRFSLVSLRDEPNGSRPTPNVKKNSEQMFAIFLGAGSRTRTYEARRREIYSLLSLPLDDSST